MKKAKIGSRKEDTGRASAKGVIVANVILRSASGKSVMKSRSVITPRTVKDFLPARETIEAARKLLGEFGFQIDLAAETHISVWGSKELYEKVFQVRLSEKRAPYSAARKEASQTQVYYVSNRPARIPARLSALIEAVEFPGPITYYVSPTPPALAYDHLEVPDDVARDMDALKAHSRGITGAGINLAMVDSGFMTPFHPYYAGKGYNIQPLVPDPADPTPNVDTVGHGTGISACALAVAPGVTYTVFKVYGSNFASAFARAVAAAPNVITCSWGVPFSAALQLSINNAVAGGILVCFACGNGGPVGWPGSEPAVISVGGAFVGNDDSLQAASYASSGTNGNNPGRQCPDLCGIVGMAPEGIFIALPTQPNSTFDNLFSGGTYPNNDTTAPDDGWLVASGTSSATPMVAATAALVMQANPAAVGNPAVVRNTLTTSCVDVTAGASGNGDAAGPGADLATGAGLVQAYRAVRSTDIWIKDNPNSDVGLVPTHNRRPAWPPYAHWVSPDIKVFSTPLANPDADFDPTPNENPVFNQDNFVYVRVRNRGVQASGLVNVRLYYADPATNLVFPADWNDGQSGVAAQGSIQVGGAGTNLQTIATINTGGQNVLPLAFVWRPPDPTTATQSQTLPDGRTIGHFCLLVRLESADDPIIYAGGGQSSVIDDNNIGMANQEVYSAPPGHMFLFSFAIRGGTEREGMLRHDVLFDLGRLPRASEVMLALSPRQKEGFRPINARIVKGNFQLTVGRKLSGLGGLVLKPNGRIQAKVGIRVPAGTKPGDYSADVIQMSQGKALGGVRMVTRVRGD